jgi:hypothetical protein
MDECQRCPSEIVELANDVMAIYDEPLKSTSARQTTSTAASVGKS